MYASDMYASGISEAACGNEPGSEDLEVVGLARL
jgi:hypothetical protein